MADRNKRGYSRFNYINLVESLVPIATEEKEECDHKDLYLEKGNIYKCLCGQRREHYFYGKKEERCTKCKGNIVVKKEGDNYWSCGHCSGSGKEPRKEDFYGASVAEEDIGRQESENAFRNKIIDLEYKLSRYKTAIETALKNADECFDGSANDDIREILRTALAEELHDNQEKDRLSHDNRQALKVILDFVRESCARPEGVLVTVVEAAQLLKKSL